MLLVFMTFSTLCLVISWQESANPSGSDSHVASVIYSSLPGLPLSYFSEQFTLLGAVNRNIKTMFYILIGYFQWFILIPYVFKKFKMIRS